MIQQATSAKTTTLVVAENEVRAFNTIKIDNNFNEVVKALRSVKVQLPISPSRSDLGKVLFNLYQTNRAVYTMVIKMVPWNESINNYTTSTDFKDKFLNHVQQLNQAGIL